MTWLQVGATLSGEAPFSAVAVSSAFQAPQIFTQFGTESAMSQVKFTCGPGSALNPLASTVEPSLSKNGSGYITLLPFTDSSHQFLVNRSVFVSGLSFQYCLKCSPGFYSEGYNVNASRSPREQW
jgi:hypothetical protein